MGARHCGVCLWVQGSCECTWMSINMKETLSDMQKGDYSVTIDGEVNPLSGQQQNQEYRDILFTANLKPGLHLLTLTNTDPSGKAWLDLDFITVTGSSRYNFIINYCGSDIDELYYQLIFIQRPHFYHFTTRSAIDDFCHHGHVCILLVSLSLPSNPKDIRVTTSDAASSTSGTNQSPA